jgi:hypothetical protein
MVLNGNLLLYSAYLAAIVVELCVDTWKKSGYYEFRDTISSIFCGVLSRTIPIYLTHFTKEPYHYIHSKYGLLNNSVISSYLYERLPTEFDASGRSDETGELTWFGVFVCVLFLDLAYYGAHRVSHEINLGWAGHSPHHSSEYYNFSTALRQGVLEGTFTAFVYWPFALLFPHSITFGYFNIHLVYQFFLHTEFVGKLPAWFEFFFNTPHWHRIHHASNFVYLDKNYGGMLIIWDRMFGTFSDDVPDVKLRYGLTTPLRTYDAVSAEFSYVWLLFSFIFRGPGPAWELVSKTLKDDHKKDINNRRKKLNIHQKVYLLFQFICTVVFAFFVLHFVGNRYNSDRTILCFSIVFNIIILWNIMNMGILMDSLTVSTKLILSDVLRCIFNCFVSWKFLSNYALSKEGKHMLATLPCIAYAIVSILLLYVCKRQNNMQETSVGGKDKKA